MARMVRQRVHLDYHDQPVVLEQNETGYWSWSTASGAAQGMFEDIFSAEDDMRSCLCD